MTFEEATDLLQICYNSSEMQAKLLTEWKTMSLTQSMQRDPNSSEAAVFRTFVARLMGIKKQLEVPYHGDIYSSDRLLTVVDVPEIQESLRDRLPRSAHLVINPV